MCFFVAILIVDGFGWYKFSNRMPMLLRLIPCVMPLGKVVPVDAKSSTPREPTGFDKWLAGVGEDVWFVRARNLVNSDRTAVDPSAPSAFKYEVSHGKVRVILRCWLTVSLAQWPKLKLPHSWP